MDKKQRLTIIGLGAVSLLLASSVALTIAWYDGSSHLAVNNFNISLMDKELSISTDNVVFTDYLTTDELNQAGKFRAVSSAFSNEWIEEKKDQPAFKGGYKTSAYNVLNDPDDSIPVTSGYFTQEFYIKCNTSVYVTFDKERTTFEPDEDDNVRMVAKIREKFPQLTDEEILFNLNNIVKSLRLSILVLNDEDDDSGSYPDYAYHIIDPYKDKTTYYAGRLDTDLNGYFDYSSEKKETLYGQSASSIEGKTVEECLVYNEPASADSNVSNKQLSCFTSGTKKDVRTINFEQSIENGLVLAEEPSVSIDDVEEEVLIPLHPNTSKRIVLSFYQEGWDLDNTDFVMYSHFFVNVLFKIAKTRF